MVSCYCYSVLQSNDLLALLNDLMLVASNYTVFFHYLYYYRL
jgi:hypothetical protein